HNTNLHTCVYQSKPFPDGIFRSGTRRVPYSCFVPGSRLACRVMLFYLHPAPGASCLLRQVLAPLNGA
ncbi:MAG: hypothetical protein NT028_13290, partial [candidate division Zixibacteria bacterium]|nr:hypothetical protein [candidate division Zixibacteria bacterium]